ncbi:L-rhamnose mutarotase [Cohnella herbarum]|uniref:L-rhamnose mutarotase n=1 Tax=Cohnella herbarum TaxID=2728023 RepID=A0A7Z2VFG8_9BACL|nr:L-rhamnose mutarotase [Cohnella herbarum]QJD82104.1 L-rhamnose mutarotase [Cohnella herbarum]
MGRHFFKLQCKPGSEQEYVERHQAVFPDLLDAFKRVGIRSYSIFMQGNGLYAYMEADDYDYAMAELDKDPANERWQAYMKDIMLPFEGGTSLVQPVDNEVFFFDNK